MPTGNDACHQHVADGLITEGSLKKTHLVQLSCKSNLELANKTMTDINNLSESMHNEIAKDLAEHARMLQSLRSDLEFVFRRSRALKKMLQDTVHVS